MANISKAELRKEINAILKEADLSSTSAKKVRQMLETKLDCTLSARKKEIDALVMDYVNDHVKNQETEQDSEEDGSEEDVSEEEVKEKKPKRGAPAKKKPAKKSRHDDDDDEDDDEDEHDDEDDDMENSKSEANSDASEEEYTPKKAAAKPKAKKAARGRKKKGSDSDSDDDWQKNKKTKKGKKRGATAYTRPYKLSAELSNLIGSNEPMPRHEVIRRVWAIIKERDLYDPDNKQFAICDDELMKVMGVKRFRTFGMMKYLKNHFLD